MNPAASGNVDLAANAPNMSLMFSAFTPTFGNIMFQITPPQPGDMDNAFPQVPYLSLEALIYQQMASNPMSAPFNTIGGSNTGQQVIGGQITQTDQNQQSRFQQGFQSSAGG